ncbi:TIGR02265 family protein [Archangium sp.]|jgi:uncharacterized protein (TIGR02265 family)|uniref:TIGR02265 family protein n=1 Tax=Archangium sp. TaxID=1872627 RepID=UPI002EDA774E
MERSEQPLEFWLQDLERRRAFVKPEHTMRGFFYKGMLGNIRTLGDEALVKRCLEACSEESFVDFFSYSVQPLFLILLTALPTLAERHGGAEAALRQIGRQASIDFLESVAGKAMVLLAGSNPRMLINNVPAAFNVAMSYGTARLEWTGQTRGRLLTEYSFVPPPFHEGMVQRLLEAGRAQDIHVSAHATGALNVVCEFSWK